MTTELVAPEEALETEPVTRWRHQEDGLGWWMFSERPLRDPKEGIDWELLDEIVAWAEESALAEERVNEKNEVRALATERPVWNQGIWISGKVEHIKGKLAWACGTNACLAGNAVLMTGALPIQQHLETLYGPGGTEFYNASYVMYQGEQWAVSDLAQRQLGLTTSQAEALFAGGNSISAIKRMVNRWREGDPSYVC